MTGKIVSFNQRAGGIRGATAVFMKGKPWLILHIITDASIQVVFHYSSQYIIFYLTLSDFPLISYILCLHWMVFSLSLLTSKLIAPLNWLR